MEVLGEMLMLLPFQPEGLPTNTFIVPDADAFIQGPVVVIV
jgi:hypothetical protein